MSELPRFNSFAEPDNHAGQRVVRNGVPCRSVLIAAAFVALGFAGPPARADESSGLEARSATRDRPLFEPSRRPPPPPAEVEGGLGAVPSALAPSKPDFEVRGVILGQDQRIAIVARPSDTQGVRLRVGNDIDGWTVEAIQPRGIVLRRADQTVTIEMATPR